MITTWRLTRPKYAATALSGEGSARYPGRWNIRGSRVAYVSEHLSLAMLEVLAHAENLDMLNQYVALKVDVPDDSISTLKSLPKDWQKDLVPNSTRKLGHEWFSKAETLLLKVPSVLIPSEHNYLINPNHEAFGRVEVAEPVELPFDSRVLRVATN